MSGCTTIICIEGCHGAGKTSIIKQLTERGAAVIDEGFLDHSPPGVGPQSLTSETLWVAKWAQRALELHAASTESRVIFADRSPWSAMLYAPDGDVLKPVIAAMLNELHTAGVDVVVAALNVDPDVLWARIRSRLAIEPKRAQYREGDRAWMDTAIAFYERHRTRWDLIINGSSSDEVTRILLEIQSKYNE